jgi:hypothetical protein
LFFSRSPLLLLPKIAKAITPAKAISLFANFQDAGGILSGTEVAKCCLLHRDGYNARFLVMQEKFFAKYQVTTKEWNPVFDKKFPERFLIDQEIKVVVKEACKRKWASVSLDFVDAQTRISKEVGGAGVWVFRNAYDEYRIQYMREHAKEMADEIVGLIRRLKSIKTMKDKVFASR